MTRPLPREITTHDLLKTAALLFMFIDHAGYYFCVDEVWFRVIGRFSAPIWFFLIGYADTRIVQLGIWIGAFIVSVTWAVSGQYLFPLNVLFSLSIARLMIDGLMVRALKDKQSLWGTQALLFFLALPSFALFEYGTLGLMFAMAGFLVRHKAALSIPSWVVMLFLGISGFLMAAIQALMMPALDNNQMLVLFGGMGLLCVVLYMFRARAFPVATKYAGPAAPLLRFTGRRTLEIYVAHLVIIAAIVVYIDPVRFSLFDYKIAPQAVLQFFQQ